MISFAQRRERNDLDYVREAIETDQLSTRGHALDQCVARIKEQIDISNIYMTSSATAALDVIAQALPRSCAGGEIIFPSWTFASTVTPFVRAGFKPVFVDVDYQTLNITDETVEKGLSDETVAVVVVHYAGVKANMLPIKKLTQEQNLFLIEDAAAAYLTPNVGMLGDFSVFSFNDTKNIGCGEGGCLGIKDISNTLGGFELMGVVDELLHKGTDVTRARKENRQYTWTQLGLAPQMTNLTAAMLLPELLSARSVTKQHTAIWHNYRRGLASLNNTIKQMPFDGNGHFYWLLFPTPNIRKHFMEFMNIAGIQTSRHYQALHSSPAGRQYGTLRGDQWISTVAESCIVRLPIYPAIFPHVMRICDQVIKCANSALARATQNA